jgi:hypothetical protein
MMDKDSELVIPFVLVLEGFEVVVMMVVVMMMMVPFVILLVMVYTVGTICCALVRLVC